MSLHKLHTTLKSASGINGGYETLFLNTIRKNWLPTIREFESKLSDSLKAVNPFPSGYSAALKSILADGEVQQTFIIPACFKREFGKFSEP